MEERFVIDNDQKAEWSLRKIKEREDDFERVKALALSEIEKVTKLIEEEKAKCDSDTAFLRAALDAYMDSVKCRETKTGIRKYKLLSGELVRKPGKTTLAHNDDVLTDYLLRSGRTDMIRVKQVPLWGEYKRTLAVHDGVVIDTNTGDVVEGVTAEMQPASFAIEWRDDE